MAWRPIEGQFSGMDRINSVKGKEDCEEDTALGDSLLRGICKDLNIMGCFDIWGESEEPPIAYP